MVVTVSIEGDGEAVSQLFRWLREDDAVARSARVSVASPIGSGHMGALEVINVALTHATGVAGLALAYASWRRSRAAAPEVTFTGNGVSIKVRDASPATIDQIVQALTPQIQAGDVDPDGRS
jgi:hypothetical protein